MTFPQIYLWIERARFAHAQAAVAARAALLDDAMREYLAAKQRRDTLGRELYRAELECWRLGG